MKYTAILLFTLAYLQANINIVTARAVNDNKVLEPEEEACISQLQLDKRQIEILNSQSIVTEDNEKYNLFLACYWQKIQWQKANGDIDFDNIKQTLSQVVASTTYIEIPAIKLVMKHLMVDAATYCENHPSKGNSHGQTAVKTQNCLATKYRESLKLLES